MLPFQEKQKKKNIMKFFGALKGLRQRPQGKGSQAKAKAATLQPTREGFKARLKAKASRQRLQGKGLKAKALKALRERP